MDGKRGQWGVNKGDLVSIDVEGKTLLVCIIGFYIDEDSGHEMALLAIVQPDTLLHIPVDTLADASDANHLWN